MGNYKNCVGGLQRSHSTLYDDELTCNLITINQEVKNYMKRCEFEGTMRNLKMTRKLWQQDDVKFASHSTSSREKKVIKMNMCTKINNTLVNITWNSNHYTCISSPIVNNMFVLIFIIIILLLLLLPFINLDLHIYMSKHTSESGSRDTLIALVIYISLCFGCVLSMIWILNWIWVWWMERVYWDLHSTLHSSC